MIAHAKGPNVRIALLWGAWMRTQRTCAWEAFGDHLYNLQRIWGADAFRLWLRDRRPRAIPSIHCRLALADAMGRRIRNSLPTKHQHV